MADKQKKSRRGTFFVGGALVGLLASSLLNFNIFEFGLGRGEDIPKDVPDAPTTIVEEPKVEDYPMIDQDVAKIEIKLFDIYLNGQLIEENQLLDVLKGLEGQFERIELNILEASHLTYKRIEEMLIQKGYIITIAN